MMSQSRAWPFALSEVCAWWAIGGPAIGALLARFLLPPPRRKRSRGGPTDTNLTNRENNTVVELRHQDREDARSNGREFSTRSELTARACIGRASQIPRLTLFNYTLNYCMLHTISISNIWCTHFRWVGEVWYCHQRITPPWWMGLDTEPETVVHTVLWGDG